MYKTFSIRFSVSATKINQSGYAPLFVTITSNSQRTTIQLNKKLRPNEFDTKKQVSSNIDINNYISIVRSKLFEIQTQLFAQNITPTPQRVKDVFNGKEIFKEWGLLELYRNHNNDFKKLVNKTIVLDSFKKHEYVYNYIFDFLKGIDINITDVKPILLNNFYNYLITVKNQSHNTAVGCMKKLKKIFNIAFAESILLINPFNSIKYKLDKTTPDFLTIDEIKKIWTKKIDIQRVCQVRDVFIFNTLTGLAYIDSKNLTVDDVFKDENGNHYIKKERQKTKVVATIPLDKIALEILVKYNYILPVISNQKMNMYLKEIADICGIHKNLTMHVARHSTATLLLNSGMSITSVSAILGHSSLKITQHYAKLIDKTLINEFNQININKKLT